MKVGIIGYGKMGREIVSLFADASWDVAVLVRDPAKAEDHAERLAKRLRRAAKGGLLTEDEATRRLAAVRFTTAWDELVGCNLVIESVVEDLAVKAEILRRAEQAVSAQAVITSNSSSLSMVRLAQELADPSRFCGYHFFHPIPLTSIVEIITADCTSPQTVAFLREASRQIKRTSLVFKGGHSCVNATLTFVSCEALHALEEGLALPSQIDAAVGRFARIGPCESVDVTGIPLFTQIVESMRGAFPLQLEVPDLCRKLIRDGRFGKYAGKGIYLYCEDRPVDDAPEYYLNPGQTPRGPAGGPGEIGIGERVLLWVYYSALSLAESRLGSLPDLCLGIQDLIGMRIDPLAEMRSWGSGRLRKAFDCLSRETGSRMDSRGLARTIDSLDTDHR